MNFCATLSTGALQIFLTRHTAGSSTDPCTKDVDHGEKVEPQDQSMSHSCELCEERVEWEKRRCCEWWQSSRDNGQWTKAWFVQCRARIPATPFLITHTLKLGLREGTDSSRNLHVVLVVMSRRLHKIGRSLGSEGDDTWSLDQTQLFTPITRMPFSLRLSGFQNDRSQTTKSTTNTPPTPRAFLPSSLRREWSCVQHRLLSDALLRFCLPGPRDLPRVAELVGPVECQGQ